MYTFIFQNITVELPPSDSSFDFFIVQEYFTLFCDRVYEGDYLRKLFLSGFNWEIKRQRGKRSVQIFNIHQSSESLCYELGL